MVPVTLVIKLPPTNCADVPVTVVPVTVVKPAAPPVTLVKRPVLPVTVAPETVVVPTTVTPVILVNCALVPVTVVPLRVPVMLTPDAKAASPSTSKSPETVRLPVIV